MGVLETDAKDTVQEPLRKVGEQAHEGPTA